MPDADTLKALRQKFLYTNNDLKVAKVLTTDMKPGISPVVVEYGDVKNKCGGRYCIQLGDKNELVQEINIRLAGFGGCTPDDIFTEKTVHAVKQFQKDYMGIIPTGKVCGNTIKAIDAFCIKYTETVSDYKCPCQNPSNSYETQKAPSAKRCFDGWGKGLYSEQYMDNKITESHRKYEYPGMHRSTLWAVSAMKFYLDHTSSPFKKIAVNRGYRCWADNDFHGRGSSNHLGKAADIWFSKNGIRTKSSNDMDILRKDVFNKYLNAKWWGHEDCLTMEKASQEQYLMYM